MEKSQEEGRGMGEGVRTAVRIVVCAVALWSLELGSYTVPVNQGSAMLVATVIATLAVYELAIRDVPPRIFGLVGAGLAAAVMTAYFIWHAYQPPPPRGPLRPAHDPSPPLTCKEKPDPGDLVIHFGTDARIGQGKGPFTTFKVGDCSVLNFTRLKDGRLGFSDIGYDYDGDVAFMIRDGTYQALLPLALRVFRPDPSTYVLLDHYDQEVIYIRYLNPNAVRVRGRFICGEAPQVEVRDKAILLGGTRIFGITTGQHAGPGHVCLKAGAQTLPQPWRRR
jgi:hypothetical protein